MQTNERNDFWDNIEISYPIYPTVRHRKRFIMKMFKKFCRPGKELFVFDYGCGMGDIVLAIKDQYQLRDEQIGGSDVSGKSIAICRKKIDSPYFYHKLSQNLEKQCDVIICSEVIEHVVDYREILEWVQANLRSGGVLLLSTQGGKLHKIDEYSGHVHSFKVNLLKETLENIGQKVVYSRQWGFPFFTWQKALTDVNFDRIRNSYLEGNPSRIKRWFFEVVYLIYFVVDAINCGPQIYICAINNDQNVISQNTSRLEPC